MINYFIIEEVLVMYRVLIKRYGGTYGLRDPGTIESALYRPQSGYYEDVIEQAAALWESMTNNQAFVDGNKRIGFACTDTFLRINSYKIEASNNDILLMIDQLLNSNEFNYINLESWLRQNTVKVNQ